jgi:hypothetical protein
MDDRPQIYGSPGERARFSGLLRAALPLGAVLLLCGYALGAFNPWHDGLPLAAKGAVVLVLATAIFLATSATQGRVDAFFKGARGEEHIALALATLPAGYTVLHGVVLGKGGIWQGHNLDHIVVGPTGITLIETKNWQGKVTFTDGRLTVDGVDPTRSPIDQVRAEARILSDWLGRQISPAPKVRPLVCFAGQALDANQLTVDEITLCRADHLIGAITQDAAVRLDPASQARIIKLLAKQV